MLLAAVVSLLVLPLPLSAANEAPDNGRDVVMTGLYSDQWESAQDITGLGAATGHPLSFTGTFHVVRESEDGWSGTTDWLLEQAWMAQTTPVANVYFTVPAVKVADGSMDADIRLWVERVKEWLARGEGRSLLIAPMQEMNGSWTPYSMDPPAFREGYRRFVQIGREMGLDENTVRWVFAPNGWSTPPHRMVDYYPGGDVVDIVGISAFNFGSVASQWMGVDAVVTSALAEVRGFAPYKPYLIMQVGSSTSGGDRDAWLRDLFNAAASDPNVVGLIYFNFIKETDWKLWDGVSVATGWQDGARLSTHLWPLEEWFQPGEIPFAPYSGVFADDDLSLFQSDIDWLAQQGLALGCDERRFCPHSPLTRGEAAAFVARAIGLAPVTVDYFTDDVGSPYESAINAIAAAGIALGCEGDRFCPEQAIPRWQIASLIAKAFALPPAPNPPPFVDVTDPMSVDEVGALTAAGISNGCGPDRFCPWAGVARQEMAALLRRAIQYRTPVTPLPSLHRPGSFAGSPPLLYPS